MFLSSQAISDSQHAEFVKLVGKEPKDITLALIENAADTYFEGSRPWLERNRAAIQGHGFDVEILDIRQYKSKLSELRTKLMSKDVIWLGGGNTFYLRWLLRDTGVDQLLIELVAQGKVYGGGSAGAIIAGPTLKHFETADDPKEAPELMLDGLHFTDVVVVPHMDHGKSASIMRDINEKLRSEGYKTAPLNDADALVIDGQQQRVI